MPITICPIHGRSFAELVTPDIGEKFESNMVLTEKCYPISVILYKDETDEEEDDIETFWFSTNLVKKFDIPLGRMLLWEEFSHIHNAVIFWGICTKCFREYLDKNNQP